MECVNGRVFFFLLLCHYWPNLKHIIFSDLFFISVLCFTAFSNYNIYMAPIIIETFDKLLTQDKPFHKVLTISDTTMRCAK